MKDIWSRPALKSRTNKTTVTLPEMIFGYFVGPFCVLTMTSIVSTYYLTFYRTYDDVVAQGAFLTLLPLISVIPMALANIIVGVLIGKTRTSAGKARPYILTAGPLLLAAGILVFCIPYLSLGFRMVWMVITYNLFAAFANPIYSTAHYLMVSLSTRNLDQRGQLSVVANIPAVAANGLISSIVMPVILNWINSADNYGTMQNRWQLIAVLFSSAAFIGCLLEYLFTRERITEESMSGDAAADAAAAGEESAEEAKIPTSQQLRECITDKFWWIVMIFYVLYQAGVMFKSGYVFNIFCHEFMTDVVIFGMELTSDLAQSVLALISGIPLAAGMLFIWPLANKFGKKNMIEVGFFFSIAGSLVCLSNPSSFPVMLVGQTLKGISSIPGSYVMMALFADVLDHLEARFGHRVDGVSMSVYNTINTVINGLAVAVFNFFYDGGFFSPSGVTLFFFLGFEIIAHGALIFIMNGLTVEKTIVEEQALIAERKENRSQAGTK